MAGGVYTGSYNPIVFAFAVSGSTLYVGGNFTSAGGVPANYVAAWNGSWSALGTREWEAPPAMCMPWQCRKTAPYMQAALSSTAGGGAATDIAAWNGHTLNQARLRDE